MAAKKGGQGAEKSASVPTIVNADEVRRRMVSLTSSASVPDPLAVRKMNVVSTGFLSLDYALKVGGWTQGRVHAFEGETGSGKTALVAATIGHFQRTYPNSVHAFLDVEGTADLKFFQNLGTIVHPSRLIMFKPESAEEACFMAMNLLGYKLDKNTWVRDPKIIPMSSITYDSWAGSPVDTAGMAGLARIGSEWWPRIATKAARVGTTMFVVNQLRTKPGVSFGNPQYSPGGSAFGFSQTTKIWVTRSHVEKDQETKAKISHDLRIDIHKSKVATPSPPLYLHLNYAFGFDQFADALSYLELRGVNMKETASGNTYRFAFASEDGSEEIISEKGREAFLDTLRGYPDAAEAFLNTARGRAAQDLTG